MPKIKSALAKSKGDEVIRSHYDEICNVLSRCDETLVQFAGKLYDKRIVTVHTKNAAIRRKGYEGAGLLIDAVEMKVKQTPARFEVVVKMMKELEDLQVIGAKMSNKKAGRSVSPSHSSSSSSEEETEPASSTCHDTSMVVSRATALKTCFANLLDLVLRFVATLDILSMRMKLNWYFNSEEQITTEVNKHLAELEYAPTPQAVLNCLIRTKLIGYLNYELLKVLPEVEKKAMSVFDLVGTVSNNELSSKIQQYESDHDMFLQSTDFNTLVDVFQNHKDLKPASAVGLPKLTLKLESPWEGRDVFSWKELLDKQFNWPPCVHVTGITRNCIIIEYSVLPFFAPAVVRDLTDPLVLAVLKRQGVTVELSQELMKMGREGINQRLHSAVIWGTVTEVEEQIKSGADVQEKDEVLKWSNYYFIVFYWFLKSHLHV